jgi:hypothetical protein
MDQVEDGAQDAIGLAFGPSKCPVRSGIKGNGQLMEALRGQSSDGPADAGFVCGRWGKFDAGHGGVLDIMTSFVRVEGGLGWQGSFRRRED